MTQPANQKAYRGRKKAKGDSRNDVWLSASLTEKVDLYRSYKGLSRAEAIRDIIASLPEPPRPLQV